MLKTAEQIHYISDIIVMISSEVYEYAELNQIPRQANFHYNFHDGDERYGLPLRRPISTETDDAKLLLFQAKSSAFFAHEYLIRAEEACQYGL